MSREYYDITEKVRVAAFLLLAARLAWTGLFRSYPLFFSFVLANGVLGVIGLQINWFSDAYTAFYRIEESIIMALAVFLILEMYRLAMAGTPALARFGQRMAGYVMLLAAVLAGAGYLLGGSGKRTVEFRTLRFLALERTMDSWLFLLVLMICCFVVWFPVRLRVNLLSFMGGFLLLFLARCVVLYMVGRTRLHYSMYYGPIANTAAVLSLLTWTVALHRRGEIATAVLGHRWNPKAMERLALQLQSINASLERLGR